MLLTQASNQLITRRPDEHFASFPDMLATCRHAREHGTEVVSSPKATFFVARNDRIRVVLSDDREVEPTHWALTQVANSCRIPMYVLERLRTDTACGALNETYPRAELSDRLALVENGRLRALTSKSYSRLWDEQVLAEVDRWLLPRGDFIPAMPTINTDEFGTNIMGNTKPCLFRSDRDSFAFFYSKDRPHDDGLGGLRKGILAYNSEVGAKAFGFSSFYFREMCANFLIWDAKDVVERRAVHKGSLENVFAQFRRELIEASHEVEPEALQVFSRAAHAAFAGDGSATDANKEKAAERLTRQFKVPQKTARHVVEASQLPENTPGHLTFWSVVNGLTSVAKEARFTSDQVNTSLVASRVLEALPA